MRVEQGGQSKYPVVLFMSTESDLQYYSTTQAPPPLPPSLLPFDPFLYT